MDGGEVIAIVAIVGVLLVAAIEKGIALPEEPGKAGETGPKPPAEPVGKEPRSDALGKGLFWLFLGVGFSLAMRVVYPESTRWGWGILLAALGLAYLVGLWLTRGKAEKEAAGRDDGGE